MITKRTLRIEAQDYFSLRKKAAKYEGELGEILFKALVKRATIAYRETLREYHEEREAEFDRIFADHGEDFTAYIILPASVTTKEAAESYFEDCLEEHCTPSQYDCTGQRFNMLLAVQKRSDGRFGVYVRYCYDV